MLNNYAETELTLTAPINASTFEEAMKEEGDAIENVEVVGGIRHSSHTPLMKPPMANQGDDDDLSFLTSPVASRMQV